MGGSDVHETREPSESLLAEARRTPGGWVYEIEGAFGPTESVPPEAIRGPWAVDENGELTGEYRANPRFRARRGGQVE
jgi:hypothetical protein